MSALNGIGAGKKASHANQLLCEQANARRRNTGDRTGPFWGFRHAVIGAAQITRQLVITGTVAIEECFVLRAPTLNFIRQCQH
ncbi:hypothetical protein D3C81_1189150 [compost metagenome]